MSPHSTARPGPAAIEERARVLEMLRKHGWNATSFQVLEPDFRYWFDERGRGCVAYTDTGSAWVVAGAPVAAREELADVASAFTEVARAAGRRASFFATERRFVESADVHAMLIGEQPVWDPGRWEESLRGSRSLREQLRRARAKGLTVRRVTAEEAMGPLRPALDGLADGWLRTRRMAPMGFLVRLDLFSFLAERRIFVAEREGAICAALVCVPVYTRRGWLFEDLLRGSDAPNGATDLLVDAAMRDLAAQGASYATLGLAPLAGRVNPWMRAARRYGRRYYDFEGVRAFKARFRPHGWDPVFLSWPRAQYGVVALLESLRAFAGGSLLRFAAETLTRTRPRLTVGG